MSEFKWTDALVKEYGKLCAECGYSAHTSLGVMRLNDIFDSLKASKQPKPEWEIVAFKHRGMIATIMDSEGYSQPHFQCPGQQFGLDWALEGHDCSIHSVKRLSDGEVFTVGETVSVGIDAGTVDSFRLENIEYQPTRMIVNLKDHNITCYLSAISPCEKSIPVYLTPAEVEKLKQILNTHE
jgi:hypothetical protein